VLARERQHRRRILPVYAKIDLVTCSAGVHRDGEKAWHSWVRKSWREHHGYLISRAYESCLFPFVSWSLFLALEAVPFFIPRPSLNPLACFIFRCIPSESKIKLKNLKSLFELLDRMEKDQPLSAVSDVYGEAQEAATYLRNALPHPELKNLSIAIICGSGLGGLADTIREGPRYEFSNHTVPHLSSPTGML
jgi:hypothetical protein